MHLKRTLTTPSCSEAFDFQSRRFVSSLPDITYEASQLYLTQNTLRAYNIPNFPVNKAQNQKVIKAKN
jgi:hypothetical protein